MKNVFFVCPLCGARIARRIWFLGFCAVCNRFFFFKNDYLNPVCPRCDTRMHSAKNFPGEFMCPGCFYSMRTEE